MHIVLGFIPVWLESSSLHFQNATETQVQGLSFKSEYPLCSWIDWIYNTNGSLCVYCSRVYTSVMESSSLCFWNETGTQNAVVLEWCFTLEVLGSFVVYLKSTLTVMGLVKSVRTHWWAAAHCYSWWAWVFQDTFVGVTVVRLPIWPHLVIVCGSPSKFCCGVFSLQLDR